jgi:chromate reductase
MSVVAGGGPAVGRPRPAARGRRVTTVMEMVSESAHRHGAEADRAQSERKGVEIHAERNTQREVRPLRPAEPRHGAAGCDAMTAPIHILGIPGSLRRGSYNHAALRAAQAVAPAVGAEIAIFTLEDIPAFNEDLLGALPPRVTALRAALAQADAVLFATPEYNYSVPGVLKNAIDWVSRPAAENAWRGKPVAVMGASSGLLGTARAQYHLRQMFVFLDMPALNQPEVMIARARDKFDAQGVLTDADTRKRIQDLVAALVAWTRRLTAGASPGRT